MFADVSMLDADRTLSAASEARRLADVCEARLLQVAAHWADLNGVPESPDAVTLPGTEQLVQLGGDGTPEVAEFAPAELAVELAISDAAAASLMADAVDLRHRLSRLWQRVLAGEVRCWMARKAAAATRHLSEELVAVVDARISRWAPSLSWTRLDRMITAVVAEADPDLAAEQAQEAEQAQGVWMSPSTEHGVTSIFIRTEIPHAIWFDATIDRIATGLRLLGDNGNEDVRRGRAVGVIAQPQAALDLFGQAAAIHREKVGDDVPVDDLPDQPREPVAASVTATALPRTGAAATAGKTVDSRPPATLYVHIAADSATGQVGGVARLEGVGPVLADQAKKWLGQCAVSVQPVIDLNDSAPVDAYEIPDRIREAVHLRSVIDVFPYATNTSRRRDINHTIPYRHPDDGGPPGQTAVDKLGPMTRFHHRIKTHGRWKVKQIGNGVFLWRTPHGRVYLTDPNGTTTRLTG